MQNKTLWHFRFRELKQLINATMEGASLLFVFDKVIFLSWLLDRLKPGCLLIGTAPQSKIKLDLFWSLLELLLLLVLNNFRTKFRKDITHKNCIARWARQFEAGVVCQETFGRPHMYSKKRRGNAQNKIAVRHAIFCGVH